MRCDSLKFEVVRVPEVVDNAVPLEIPLKPHHQRALEMLPSLPSSGPGRPSKTMLLFSILLLWTLGPFVFVAAQSRVIEKRTAAPTLLTPDILASFDRGFTWLEQNILILQVDTLLQLRFIQGALPDSEIAKRARTLAERALPLVQQNDPSFSLFSGLGTAPWKPISKKSLPAYHPAPGTMPNPLESFNEDFSDTCLAGAWDCRWAPQCKEYKLSSGHWGYVLSHQVLFFAIAKHRKCEDKLGVDLDKELERLASAMFYEQTRDREFSDLMAERLGLGFLAGYQEFLEQGLVENVLKAQTESGCWTYGAQESECRPHPTGMALWVYSIWLRENGKV